MKRFVALIASVVLPAILVLSVLPGLASVHRYIENFATTQYKDTLNTTAWWDTVSATLKLPPFEPTLIGSCDTPDYPCYVAVSGDYAYVADGRSGLKVMDITDPANPSIVGSYWLGEWPDDATTVAVSGDYACVLGDTFYVLDISDPTHPTKLGCCDYGGRYGMAISGDYVYIGGIEVIDISDPTSPSIVAVLNTGGFTVDVALSGDYAILAGESSAGMQIVDISDPTNPFLVSEYPAPYPNGVAVSGNYVFVADSFSGLLVIDISDPMSPSLVGSSNPTFSAQKVAVSGDYAYVTTTLLGLLVFDVSDPTSPSLVGSFGGTQYNHYCIGVVVSGEHAYVTQPTAGLWVIDICDPVTPVLAGSCDTPGEARDVAIAGDQAYVADRAAGLRVIDIEDPLNPSVLGYLNTPGDARGLAIAGDYAYVADVDSLQVIDISDPANPSSAGSLYSPDDALDVVIEGDYAYVADALSGLLVADISDPTNPTLAGSYNTSGNAYDVAVAGDFAFVADGASGLQVIDISDPASPTLAGTRDTPGTAYCVAVSGDYAYVADYGSGLQVIRIANPASPWLAGNCDTPGNAVGVYVSGDYAFVADEAYGLHVIDISDPENPLLLWSVDTPGSACRVAVEGDFAFVADAGSGLQVIDVFQRTYDVAANAARSLCVTTPGDTTVAARLSTVQTDSIRWELSADGGASWQSILPNGSWNKFTVPGTDLLWRSTLAWAPGANPSATHLEIDWLYEAASIDSIVDVPNDQGGWVRVYFTRATRDFADQTTLPISEYGIWRRLDSGALAATFETPTLSTVEKSAAAEAQELDGIPIVTHRGRTYAQPRQGPAATSLPPGTWEWVASVPALQQDVYLAAVPTLADSSASGTNYTVIVVTAHTTDPEVWYVTAPDSGYSVDNLPPGVPGGFRVTYNAGSSNELAWEPCQDEDFQCFRIYRGESEDFEPGPGNVVHTTSDTSWLDAAEEGWRYYYKITAVDFTGNESDPASPETVTGNGAATPPTAFALYQNVPNPFNPVTAVRFDLPVRCHVTLAVYNVKGQLIRMLVDDEIEAGRKEFIWDGRDSAGRGVASGIYFYRLRTPAFNESRKMILLR